MGQQQLLLLVLGIVIVGLAVVVGIQAFGENQKKANADALTNDAIRIASDAQAWALKPMAFGGGNGSFATVTFPKLGYEVTASKYRNLNGEYTLTEGTAGTAGAGTNGTSVAITGCNKGSKNFVTTTVRGTGPSNITTDVTTATASQITGCAV